MKIKYTVKKVNEKCSDDLCNNDHTIVTSRYKINNDTYGYAYDCCRLKDLEHVKKMLKDQAEFTESEVKKNAD